MDKPKQVDNYKFPLIIGFSGKMGSGKDYIAKEVVGNYLRTLEIDFIHMAFGDAIKVHLMATTDVTYESLYIKKTTDTRKLLQEFGTETRKIYDKIRIKHLNNWIEVYGHRGVKVILISDVRFPIEYEYIKEKGGIIFRIIAPERTMKKIKEETNEMVEDIEKISTHISEIALDHYSDYDGIIYNDETDIKNEINSHLKTQLFLTIKTKIILMDINFNDNL